MTFLACQLTILIIIIMFSLRFPKTVADREGFGYKQFMNKEVQCRNGEVWGGGQECAKEQTTAHSHWGPLETQQPFT